MAILASAIEVGSVRALIPVCVELVKGGHSLFIERRGHFNIEPIKELTSSLVDLPQDENDLGQFIRDKNIKVVLFSVNVHDPRPLRIARIAQSLGVQTVHLLDYWNGYRARMELDGEEVFYPTRYLVPDEYARQKALEEEIPLELIRVMGQPAFADGEANYKTASQQTNPLAGLADNNCNIIMFASEPVAHDQGSSLQNLNYRGYTENAALQLLVNALKIMEGAFIAVVLPHPREDAEALETQWKRCGGASYGMIKKGLRGRDLLPFVQGVAGMASTLLYEAWLVGKPVLSIQPSLRNDSLRVLAKKEGIMFIDQYSQAEEKIVQWLSGLVGLPLHQPQTELERHKQAPIKIAEVVFRMAEEKMK